MKVIDIFFSLTCGIAIAFLAADFLTDWGAYRSYQMVIIWVTLPIISLFCLWLAYIIGQKFLFIFQGAKFLLVGAFSTIVDLKLFELLLWVFVDLPIFLKAISFVVATILKYWGNKYWSFLRHEKENLHWEVGQFFLVTLIGLVIDLGFFYYLYKVIGPQFQIPNYVWIKLSVILSAMGAALFNFLGYKFLVFKK